MKPQPVRIEAGRGRPLFILSLWLSLCVALFSALAPLGPPSSRFTGSAFNPATTGVVLKARAQANPIALQVTKPDGDGRAPMPMPAAIWLLPLAWLLASSLFRPVVVHSASFRFLAFHLLSPLRARAPPALS